MVSSRRIAVSVDGSEAPPTMRALVAAADAAGAANLWIAAHLFNRDPVASAAVALTESRHLGVVLMAISPYTMHPVQAAMAAATLDEFFPGRVQLCFGVGAPAGLKGAGVTAERPVETLRETLDVTRELLSGEAVKYDGRRFRISGRLATGAKPLPLWLAASGPQMLELAGERADGVVISAATSPAFIRLCLEAVRRGEGRANRTIRKAALVVCSVHAEARRAHDRVRRLLAYVLRGAHHARNLELAGSRLDQDALAAAFAAEDWARADELMTDDTIMRHGASGTADQARAMLDSYGSAGLDEIVLYGIHDASQLQQALAMMVPQAASARR